MGLDSVPSRNDEFNDFERQDLLTGEPRYVEDEIRNTNFAKIFGILGLLYAIVSMALVWVLYHRDRNRTFLWHGIWMCVIILFFFFYIAWAFITAGKVKSGIQPSSIMTGLVFISSLVFIGYLLVESVWLILYRKVHFDYLVGYSTDQDTFNNRYPNGFSFNDAWKQDRRMIWWVVFFNLATVLTLAFIAYTARSVSWNRYTLARATLYLALTIMALAAWLMIYWVQESYNYRAVLPDYFLGNLLGVTKAWAIIALVFAGVNAIVNFFQFKIGYFVMALLEIALIIAMVMTAGVLLRQVRNAQFNRFYPGGCTATQYSINEGALDDRWCAVGGKYLPSGQTCLKSGLVNRWETNNEVRFLNPGCCDSSNYYYIYPFMLIGFWSLVCIYCTAVAVGCNLYIADSSEYLTASNKAFTLVDFIGLAAVLLMIIAWGIYMIARSKPSLSAAPNPNYAAFLDPANNPIPGFDLVPDALKVNANTTTMAVNTGCFAFNSTGAVFPTFSTSNACNDPTKCLLRLAMLFPGSSVQLSNNGGASQGSNTNRALFFPDCTSSTDDYLFYYGTQTQLSQLLGSLSVCPRTTGATSANYYMYVDQVSQANLQANGQLTSESAVANVVTNVDGPNCGNGYATATSCVGSCKIATTLSQGMDTVPLKGRLFFVQNNVQNFNIPNQVSITAYNRNNQVAGPSALYSGGIFTILNVPRYSNYNYILTVDITDPSGVFLEKKIDVLVDLAGSGNTELSAGYIRLDTKDGNICASTDTTCINNQKQLFGTINAVNVDGKNTYGSVASPGLAGVNNQLLRWWQVSGQSFGNMTSNSDGTFQYTNIPYDSYTIISNKTGYKPVDTRFDLQNQTIAVPSITLRPTIDSYDMVVQAKINQPNVDFDLNMMVQSDKGTSCTVSPLNKYCAYSADLNDIAFNSGEEDIVVQKLAVATYMAWLAPSFPYNNNCPAALTANTNSQQYHSQSWDWNTFKQTQNLSQLNFFTDTYAPKTTNIDITSFSSLLALLDDLPNVESNAEALVNKTILNINGVIPIQNISQNTFFGNGTTNITVVPTIPNINGTISTNTSVNSSTGLCTSSLNTVQFNNNTAFGYVNVTHLINSTVCPNGTNFTTDVTNSSYFGFDQTRSELFNNTFTTAWSNGSSIVQRNNSNFTFPNGTFTLIRGNATNSSIVTGVNTAVTNPPSFAINVLNTNHTYNESSVQYFNTNSSNLTNTSTLTVVETDYTNSTLDQNFLMTLSSVFYPAANLTGNATQNTSSFQVYSFGNVTLRELCYINTLSNGSSVVLCNITNTTTFSNGTTITSNSTKNNTFTSNVNAGANIVQLSFATVGANTSSNATFFTRSENYSTVQLPSGTNSSQQLITVNTTNNTAASFLTNIDIDINDVNNTNLTSQSQNDTVTMVNGTSYNASLIYFRTTTLNATNATIKNYSKYTTNDTNQSNSTYNELRLVNTLTNGTNISSAMIANTFNIASNFSLPNYTISNQTTQLDFNVGSFITTINNSSTFAYPNSTNTSYQVSDTIMNTSNSSNLSTGNLIVSSNYSNNSSLLYIHTFFSQVSGNNTNVNMTILTENENRTLVNVSGTNETFTNATTIVSQPVPVNNTNQNLSFTNMFTNVMYQNLSYSNNTTIIENWNTSNSKISQNLSSINENNETTANYSLNTIGGNNITWYFDNLTQNCITGCNNISSWTQYNTSVFPASTNSSSNFSNYSIYNFSYNITDVSNITEKTTNISVNLSQGANKSNPTVVINASLYSDNITYPNGTFSNTSNIKRNYSENQNSFSLSFNESNTVYNVGVSANNSSHEISLTKFWVRNNYLTANLTETLNNNTTNFTTDYRFNDSNKVYISNYTQNHSDRFSADSTANRSNVTWRNSTIMNSSINYNVSFDGYYFINTTGYNLDADFYRNFSLGNTTQFRYAPSSANLNNTTITSNYFIWIQNASNGDARNMSTSSPLGSDGFFFIYSNWSLNSTQPVNDSNTSIQAYTTLNWTLNNLTGIYRNGSSGLSYRNYTYSLFNQSLAQNTSTGPLYINNYNFSLFDSSNVSGGTNNTLIQQINLTNGTGVSYNTTSFLWENIVCQASGNCIDTVFENSTSYTFTGQNQTSYDNYTINYTNIASNITGIDSSIYTSTLTATSALINTNSSSNRTLGNGSNFTLANTTVLQNSTTSGLFTVYQQNNSYLFFFSPLVNGSFTGLNRSYQSFQTNHTNYMANNTYSLMFENMTADLISLPGGIYTVYNNFTINQTVNNNTQGTLSTIVNRSRLIPNPSAGTPNTDYNNSTIFNSLDNNTVRIWYNTTYNYSGFVAASGDSSSFGGYLRCDFFNYTEVDVYVNTSTVTLVNMTSTCVYSNGSIEVNTTNKFLISTTGSTPTGNVNFTRTVNGTVVVSTTSTITAVRRRMLMEKATESHKQGGSFTGSGNYIFISCFTGFGGASVININAIVDNQPDMNTCLTRINNERSQYTVQKLRQAVNNYQGN